ncbi:hypothetical protein ACIGXM_04735 [Kitasatospora sp. NPDC052896]|uniref:LppU/SCO3897 family protein n=1 Tax=Kitasatospora sp. NPDC052896 TaxID=3364061 RepID=UPI0037C70C26
MSTPPNPHPYPGFGPPPASYGPPPPPTGGPPLPGQGHPAPPPAIPERRPTSVPDGPACRFCGGRPALAATVRGHRGRGLLARPLRRPGPYCVVCGTATIRDLSQQTLLRGWWGYLSPVLAPAALLRNRAVHRRLRELPPPPAGSHGPQLDPGVPLTRRPAIGMLVVPALPVLALAVLLTVGPGDRPLADRPSEAGVAPSPRAVTASPAGPAADPTGAAVGDCLRDDHPGAGADDPAPVIELLSCTDHRAEYRVVERVPGSSDGPGACRAVPGADSWYSREQGSRRLVLCLTATR